MLLAIAAGLWASLSLTNASSDQPGAKGNGNEPEYVQGLRSMAQGDALQLAALEDGWVTPEEHERSFHEYIDCIEAAGFRVFEMDPGRGLRRSNASIALAGEFTQAAIQDAHNSAGKCRGSYLNAVDITFAQQLPVLNAAQVAELTERLLACVANGGVPGVSTPDQAYDGGNQVRIPSESAEKYAQCARIEQEKTGVYSPAPILE